MRRRKMTGRRRGKRGSFAKNKRLARKVIAALRIGYRL